jgi:GNAT superfamily N-acetyltransferase
VPLKLTTATGDLLETILDGTFTIWSEGLTRRAYSQWNRGMTGTAWGRQRLRRVALLRDDELLASAKRYDFAALIGGKRQEILGIGAVFTPPGLRGRGHARALVEHMLADAEERGCTAAVLFSEIGGDYYASMGFAPVDREVVSISVRLKPGAPMVMMRSAEVADLPLIAQISQQYNDGAGFAFDRTPDLIMMGVARQRLLAGLGPPGLRQVEFFVTEEGNRAAAYVVMSRGPAGAFLLECGDRDPAGARVGAMLQVLAARTPAEQPGRLRAGLPPNFRPPQIDILETTPAAELMMVRAVGSNSLPPLDPAIVWQTDVF